MILYFSGTGNSLSAARLLARETGDTAVHVIDLTTHCGTCRGIQDKVIGFVFPVYFGDLPDPVREFVEYTRFAPSTYFYAVATCGGTAGNALYNLKEILERKRCRLSYGRAVPMIANSTATWKKGVTYDFSRLDEARKKTDIHCDGRTGSDGQHGRSAPVPGRIAYGDVPCPPHGKAALCHQRGYRCLYGLRDM